MAVKVAIIGTGHIARVAHAPAYQAVGAEIIACADVVSERARRFAEAFSIPDWTADYREVLRRDEVEAVSVTVPNRWHEAITVAALAAGKHVLCEKPMATDGAAALRMVEAARRSGRILMIGFHNRFRAEAERLKAFIEGGDLGTVRYARASWMRRRGSGWGWYSDRARSGGGALIDIGVHALDLALWLMGAAGGGVASARTFRQFGRYALAERREWQSADFADGIDAGQVFDVEDLGTALLHFESGPTLLLEAAWASNFDADDALTVDLSGDRMGAHLFPLRCFGERRGALIDETVAVGNANPFEAEIRQFIADIGEGRPAASRNSAEEGYRVQRILDAIYQSAAQEGASVPF